MAMRLSLVLTILLMLCACTSTKYVEVPVVTYKVVNDSIVSVKVKVDSVYQRDSIYINTYTKGDTVFRDKYRLITRWRDRRTVDTLYYWHTDTVKIRESVPIEVEKKLSWWQSVKQELGGIAMGVAVTLLLFVAFLLYRKFKP